jgi:hypothetical protein
VTINDTVNGGFEAIGGICIWLNVRRLMRDKSVRGVDWRVTAFFWAWGIWNLFFYPSLHQWASFAGGLVIVAGNFAWLWLAIKYRKS